MAIEKPKHLFDSSGRWIAFKQGRYVFSPSGKWIGWMPWDDIDVVRKDGQYMGSILSGNRLLKNSMWRFRGYPGYPGYPPYPGYPGYPGFPGYFMKPLGIDDLQDLEG